MTPRATLAMQTQTLSDEVRRERARLDQHILAAEGKKGSAQIPKEVFHRLRAELATRQQRLQDLSESLDEGADLGRERTAYRSLNRQCQDLFGECLAIFTAEATRSLRLDDGACEIVEKTLRGIGTRIGIPWPHVATLSEAEFFGTASQVIRIRYPVSSVWDYPIAAHEFGHFAGPRWPAPGNGDSTAYQTFLGLVDFGPRSHLAEYFADMFATFVLGPAYVGTCLLRRFDPIANGDDDHPSDRERAEWILLALESLAESAERDKPGSTSATYFSRIVAEQRASWAGAVAESGGKDLDETTLGRLQVRSGMLWKALMDWASEVAYKDVSGAMSLRAAFLDKRGRDVPAAGLTIPDILNAAWMLRTGNGTDRRKIEEIEGWARDLCTKAPE